MGAFHGEDALEAGRANLNGTVKPPRRRPNAELRSREHLTEAGG
jgi:hypothetical protein